MFGLTPRRPSLLVVNPILPYTNERDGRCTSRVSGSDTPEHVTFWTFSIFASHCASCPMCRPDGDSRQMYESRAISRRIAQHSRESSSRRMSMSMRNMMLLAASLVSSLPSASCANLYQDNHICQNMQGMNSTAGKTKKTPCKTPQRQLSLPGFRTAGSSVTSSVGPVMKALAEPAAEPATKVCLGNS